MRGKEEKSKCQWTSKYPCESFCSALCTQHASFGTFRSFISPPPPVDLPSPIKLFQLGLSTHRRTCSLNVNVADAADSVMEEGGGGPAVDWANLDSDLLLLISGKLPGPGVGAQECVCKPWREAIASDPAVYLRLLRGVAPAEAEQLVKVRGTGGYGGVTS